MNSFEDSAKMIAQYLFEDELCDYADFLEFHDDYTKKYHIFVEICNVLNSDPDKELENYNGN